VAIDGRPADCREVGGWFESPEAWRGWRSGNLESGRPEGRRGRGDVATARLSTGGARGATVGGRAWVRPWGGRGEGSLTPRHPPSR
jgi:hypothetical protein